MRREQRELKKTTGREKARKKNEGTRAIAGSERRWEGEGERREEGRGRGRGTQGVGAAVAAVAAAPASCLLTRSQCPEPAARLGRFAAPAPAWGPEASPAPGYRTARLAGPSPGRATEAGRWLGGVRGDPKLGALWVHRAGVWVPVQGRGLCSAATNFPPAPWVRRLPWPGPGSGRRVWRGAEGGWLGLRERPGGSMRDVESLGWARRASSGRSQDAAAAAPPRAGEDPRVAVRVSGRRNLPALSESGVSRPRAVLDVRDLRPAPRPSEPGPDAELRGRAQVPAEPKPSRCHAQRGLTPFSS